MANYRKQYLDHLERWLNYEEESSTPPIVEDGKIPPTKKSLLPVPCLPIVLPLPSCAREEASEEWANNKPTLEYTEAQNRGKTVTQKIKGLLGL
ncbi:hypothetical protein N0V87_009625 [Didymella glomerata]|uniref:Uncharacterized protein n=1 Tax=Didymella glomerata TaxID=749621 RepID=A0A9W8WQR9_9PLEO|nr:hypothetical protein N0V87_009625 [Didymella glomerata]